MNDGALHVTDLRNLLPTSGAWPLRPRTTHVVIHHSATPVNTTPTAIARYHVGRGYPGAAYHYLVYADGQAFQINADAIVMRGYRVHGLR